MGAALDPLGAGDDGFCRGEMRSERGDGLAQILRGRCDQDDVRSRGNGDIVSHFDARLQLHARQLWI